MFSDIHDGLMRYVRQTAIFLSIFIVIGIGVACVSFIPGLRLSNGRHSHSQHDASSGERVFIFLVGVVFAGAGTYGITSTADWMRRASRVMRTSQPVSIRLSTRIERTGSGRNSRLAMYAALTPSTPHPDMPPIVDVPIYIGVQSSFSRYTTYQDADAQVFLGHDQRDPMVIIVGSELLVSERRYQYQTGRR